MRRCRERIHALSRQQAMHAHVQCAHARRCHCRCLCLGLVEATGVHEHTRHTGVGTRMCADREFRADICRCGAHIGGWQRRACMCVQTSMGVCHLCVRSPERGTLFARLSSLRSHGCIWQARVRGGWGSSVHPCMDSVHLVQVCWCMWGTSGTCACHMLQWVCACACRAYPMLSWVRWTARGCMHMGTYCSVSLLSACLGYMCMQVLCTQVHGAWGQWGGHGRT